MSVYLFALTSSGGVPLYSRTIGNSDVKPLPYPVIGSLNGVHMYGRGGDVELLSAHSEQCNVGWKSFHDSITLILVADKSIYCQQQVDDLLQMSFDAMVMLLGQDELIVIKNVERFKRDIRVCFSLLDYILSLYSTNSYSDITQCVDTLSSRPADILQNSLNAFTDAAGSSHGCLIINSRVIVTTSEWLSLSHREQILLCHLVSSLPSVSAGRDIPIYLPSTSPNIAQRLVTFTLVSGAEVCLLCGPMPSLLQLEKDVERFWQPSLDSLRLVKSQIHRNLPKDFNLDPNILGLALVNTQSRRCLCSYPSEYDETNRVIALPVNNEARRQMLRDFMLLVRESYPGFSAADKEAVMETDGLVATEAYSCLQSYKLYAVNQPPYQIYVLYSLKIPTYALGSVSKKLLGSLARLRLV